eukprot:CAMPEP_0172186622 /NCGR_PEP_ID=MMETSP1050-20130122/20859_1 /TAXON_ID=233186 /ORGANISM="Cryptomonas curvata, Strain CCAP979/52" /LENGTH=95 /DNA_ID=CAMNT_0012860803 /DNA_START=1175 /DNA_END=1462 /DNA_ORIENTATION=-
MDIEVTGLSYIDGGKIAQGTDQPSPSPTPCTPLGDTLQHSVLLLPLLADATVVGRTRCCAGQQPAECSLVRPYVEDGGSARCPSEAASRAERRTP